MIWFLVDIVDIVFVNPIGIVAIILGFTSSILLIKLADKVLLIYFAVLSVVLVTAGVLGAILDGSSDWLYVLLFSIPFAVGYIIVLIVYSIIKHCKK